MNIDIELDYEEMEPEKYTWLNKYRPYLCKRNVLDFCRHLTCKEEK